MVGKIEALKIAVVGLSSSTTFELKNKIRSGIPEQYHISWLNITDADVHVLVIERDFMESPSIQKILFSRSILVLQVCRDLAHAGELIGSVLHLPLSNDAALLNWLQFQIVESMLGEDVSSASPFLNPSTLIDAHVFELLASKTQGMIKLIDSRGMLGVADTDKELFWPALQRRPDLPIDHTLAVTYFVNRNLKEVSSFPVDLKQWVWATVWRSPLYMHLVSTDDHIRILFWPQPSLNDSRAEVLRLTAFFSNRSLSISQIADHVSMPISYVQHFASSLIAAGLAEIVPLDERRVAKSSVAVTNPSLGLVGLFKKLRAQLGI